MSSTTSTVHDIGAIADFVPGKPYRVEVAGQALAVVRKGDRFYALRDRCLHQGARLSNGRVGGTPLPCKPGEAIGYGRTGEILTCPWHGWEYDVCTGRSLANPEKVRVRTYPVRVEGGRVLVDLS
jgi:3-phenylpropionate/trans-cinnamate dioxygenase ferredoxin subunit